MSTVTAPRSKARKSSAPPSPIGPTVNAITSPETLERVDLFKRHPHNRVPRETAIVQIAESLKQIGQLEAVLARRRPGTTKYQLLSGEARWLAHRRCGFAMLRARIIECTDAEALALLAAGNAHRTDLTVLERARLARVLCQPESEGGAGLTRVQAADQIGLTSPAAVSNLIKLLDAPEPWQRVFEEGLPGGYQDEPRRLHEGTLREIARYAQAPQLCEELLADLVKDSSRPCMFLDTRDDQIEWIDSAVRPLTRDLAEKRYYGGLDGVHCHEWLKPIFKIDQATRERLQIVVVPARGEDEAPRELALNVEEFDRLQWEAIAARQKKREAKERRETQLDAGDPDSLAAKEEAPEAKLQRFAEEWQLGLLRIGLAQVLDVSTGPLMFVALVHALELDGSSDAGGLDGVLCRGVERFLGEKAPKDMRWHASVFSRTLKRVADKLGHDAAACSILTAASKRALWPADDGQLPEVLPPIEPEVVRLWAAEHGVTLEYQWNHGRGPSAQREWIRALLNRHTKSQLFDLYDELRIELPDGVDAATSKADLVEDLLSVHQKQGLDLPKIAGGAKSKKRKNV